MDKHDKDNKPDGRSIPWGIILGFLGTVLVAYLGYLGTRSPIEIPIRVTQTVEARLTQAANINPSEVVLNITETPEVTQIPSSTSLPGLETLPLDMLGKSIPWLPMENTARPSSYYYLFNLSQPPFTNVLVRQAFAAAIDREAIVRIAKEFGETNARPAMTFTPPETLGRDLYNAVGIAFHPAKARQLLTQAGYTSVDNFPPIVLLTLPGVNKRIGEEMIRMWQIYLGVNVTLEAVPEGYYDRIQTDPSEIFVSLWSADYNDPDGFLAENFHTGYPYNYNHFSNNEFDELIDRAAAATDPALRQELYIQAEQILCETEVAVIPIYHTTLNIP
jgi:ABC-type transport system substrate-binding protein